ncbi:hypothetical protein ACFSTA_00845 [Ornithinibacillus salinisoli]|uniref:Uncharacterized protein n=1 Tax=Ornithinibacillus salinisoli TaxID=1848459 RepID=A0ABW4VWE2_9BACI
MKQIVSYTILTSFIIALIIWIASIIVSFSYVEWIFFIGLGLSVVLFFFNSSRGVFAYIRGGSLTTGLTFETNKEH